MAQAECVIEAQLLDRGNDKIVLASSSIPGWVIKITADPGLEHDASLACPDMFQHTLRPTPARLEAEGRAHETLQALIQSKGETLASLLERVTLSKVQNRNLGRHWTFLACVVSQRFRLRDTGAGNTAAELMENGHVRLRFGAAPGLPAQNPQFEKYGWTTC